MQGRACQLAQNNELPSVGRSGLLTNKLPYEGTVKQQHHQCPHIACVQNPIQKHLAFLKGTRTEWITVKSARRMTLLKMRETNQTILGILDVISNISSSIASKDVQMYVELAGYHLPQIEFINQSCKTRSCFMLRVSANLVWLPKSGKFLLCLKRPHLLNNLLLHQSCPRPFTFPRLPQWVKNPAYFTSQHGHGHIYYYIKGFHEGSWLSTISSEGTWHWFACQSQIQSLQRRT